MSPRRTRVAVGSVALVVLALALLAIAVPPRASAAPVCRASSPTSGAYTVTVCLSAPEAGSTLTGDAAVSATVAVSNGKALRSVQFSVGSTYVLTDYEAPWTMILPTARWADGAQVLRVRAVVKGSPDFTTAYTTMNVSFSNGAGPPVADAFVPHAPEPLPGSPLVVAAVGDGANGGAKAAAVVGRIAAWNPDMVLYLGDVYARGTHTEFRNWFAESPGAYGRFAAITNPTIGNHEYEFDPSGAPYYDYWGNPAHSYSFDTGGWHFVSLDTTTTFAQTTPGTEQFEWLREDLRGSGADCTLAYFHHPIFTRAAGNEEPRLLGLWSLLAEEGVDLVLVGHAHHYTRWKPIGADRVANADGPVQLTVGSGGHFLYPFTRTDTRAAAGNDKKFGALRLELRPGQASYRFQAAGGALIDQSSRTCTPFEDREPPTAPVLTGEATGETTTSLDWTASEDNVGAAGYRVFRDGVEIETVGPSVLAFDDAGLEPATTYVYAVEAFDASGAAAASNLVELTTASPPN